MTRQLVALVPRLGGSIRLPRQLSEVLASIRGSLTSASDLRGRLGILFLVPTWNPAFALCASDAAGDVNCAGRGAPRRGGSNR